MRFTDNVMGKNMAQIWLKYEEHMEQARLNFLFILTRNLHFFFQLYLIITKPF
jgi:hypothetical protein